MDYGRHDSETPDFDRYFSKSTPDGWHSPDKRVDPDAVTPAERRPSKKQSSSERAVSEVRRARAAVTPSVASIPASPSDGNRTRSKKINPLRRGYLDKGVDQFDKRRLRSVVSDIVSAAHDIPEGIAKPSKPSKSPARVSSYFVYTRRDDGTERDDERLGRKAADKSFERAVASPSVVLAELWETETGELLLRWERPPSSRMRKKG